MLHKVRDLRAGVTDFASLPWEVVRCLKQMCSIHLPYSTKFRFSQLHLQLSASLVRVSPERET